MKFLLSPIFSSFYPPKIVPTKHIISFLEKSEMESERNYYFSKKEVKEVACDLSTHIDLSNWRKPIGMNKLQSNAGNELKLLSIYTMLKLVFFSQLSSGKAWTSIKSH